MYLYEVESKFQEGTKIRRAAWPKGHTLSKEPAGPVELSAKKKTALGLSANAPVDMGDVNIYCNAKGSAVYGYTLTSEDRAAQDWEEAA